MPAARSTDLELEAVIAREALRGERAVSIARAIFCALVLARLVAIGLPLPHSYLDAPVLVLVIGASLYILARSRGSGATPRVLVASGVLDAATCFFSLAPDVIWPWHAYGGLLTIPDSSALLVVIAVSAFRLVRRAVVASVVANIASTLLLFTLDFSLNRARLTYDLTTIPLFALFFGTTAAVAFFFSGRTLRVVKLGAESMVQAERARGNLGIVLHDHHDVRTSLSAAMLDVDLLEREVASGADPERVERRIERVRQSQERIAAFVGRIREHTQRELEEMRATSAAAIGVALAGVLPVVRERYADVALVKAPEIDHMAVLVQGGAPSLERVLLNLLVNACEGDGARGASNIRVEAHRLGRDRLAITFIDDGPGFGTSDRKKPEGSGLGLGFVRGVVEASGGRLRHTNRGEGGAEVVIELLEAPV